jgi:cyclophilin family peptidyl-prolyl cis-trans isomerase
MAHPSRAGGDFIRAGGGPVASRIHRAIEPGIAILDTAEIYGPFNDSAGGEGRSRNRRVAPRMRRSPFSAFLLALFTMVGVLATGSLPAGAAGGDVSIAIVTNLGTIEVALDPVHAPVTVKNFLHYVDSKFYDGGSFFRAVPMFVIQGGDKARETAADRPISLEPPLKTGLKNVDGAISMARTPDPDSATSEFFICDGDQARLDGSMTQPGYAAFGHVTKNMDLVRRIARLPAADQMLITPVKIISIRRIP